MSKHPTPAEPSGAKGTDLTRDMRLAQSSGPGDSADFDLEGLETAISVAPMVLPYQLGEYKITELIGTGGMGHVYRAEHRRMGRVVALKMLAPQRMREPSAVERFYAEMRAAARVLHPNIVTAFDAGEVDERHYLAMEFVNGETLSQLVDDSGPLPEADAVRYICQAAEGLGHAHAAGIIHRDVKPSNLMLASGGTVKVLDLGLADLSNDAQRKSQRGKLVGTIEYMAPEQIADPDAADQRSDIYSLGATLFFLLTGRSPYEGGLLEQARAHRDAPPPELFRIRPNCDLRLDHVFQRMMAKAPESRYKGMFQLLEDLRPLEDSVASGRSPRLFSGLSTEPRSTAQGLSTASLGTSILGVDLGMFYAAAAVAEPGGAPEIRPAGRIGPLLRCAISDIGESIRFGEAAINHRRQHPEHVSHCLQLYVGQSSVDRRVAGQRCPPEALIGMLLRQLTSQAWTGRGRPVAAAVSVPACYDQLHRRSILRAAGIAGLPAPRLVDRPLAAAHSQLLDEHASFPVPNATELANWMVVSIAGNAMEASVVRHLGGHFQTLAAVGSWSGGVLAWQQRLVDLAAADVMRKSGVDPRRELRSAAALQLACESALRMLLIKPATELDFHIGRRRVRIPISRETLYAACHDLLGQLEAMIDRVLGASQIDAGSLDRCLLVGSVARLPRVAEIVHQKVGRRLRTAPVDQPAMACGVAAIAAEAISDHGPTGVSGGCNPYDLGLLVRNDRAPGQRAAIIVPRFAPLPAQILRRVRRKYRGRPEEMVFVEASTWEGNAWRALGSYHLDESHDENPLEAKFEVDSSGLLHVSFREPATGLQQQVPPLPQSTLGPDEVNLWRDWVEEVVMSAEV